MQLIIDSSNVVVFFVQSLNKAYNLSKEEILATVEEGWKRLEGTWVDTKHDIEEQKKFWSILINYRYFSRYHSYIHDDAKISSTFLRNNANFLK